MTEEVKNKVKEASSKKALSRSSRKVPTISGLVGMKDELHTLITAVENNFPALLVGDTGCGKTYILYKLAEHYKRKCMRINLNGEVGISELVGRWLVKDGSTYWIDGPLVQCMKRGDWIVLDEINSALPEILFVLNSLMDDGKSIVLCEKDGEVVNAHPDFRIFATMNPTKDYVGTKELNHALLSRFIIVLNMKYPHPQQEFSILQEHCSTIDSDIAKVMVDVGNALRSKRSEEEIMYICSTRDLVSWARVFTTERCTLVDAFQWAVLNKATDEDRELVAETAKNATNIEIYWRDDFNTKRKSLTTQLEKEIEILERKRDEIRTSIKELRPKLKALYEHNLEVLEESESDESDCVASESEDTNG